MKYFLSAILLIGLAIGQNQAFAYNIDEFCLQGPPPPGFAGPNPTGMCDMVWSIGGLTISGEHHSTVTPLNPSTAEGDFDIWGNEYNILDVNPGETSSLHHWVIQTVCANQGWMQIRQSGKAIGYRAELGTFPISWVINEQRTDRHTGTYNNSSNCS